LLQTIAEAPRVYLFTRLSLFQILMMAAGLQWRETAGDAVYTQPDIPVAGTAGRVGRYTRTYGQLRADCTLTPHVALVLEAVHFAVGEVIRAGGGHDGNYVGAEVRFTWYYN
jgi:hypothetical protein